ncbi:glycoside hydrolase family 35 protein [Sphingobacterium spiritivorum]|uniref:glycoside hydrolase family 35 protein n=1 Tax=Sphingobacterium spiritivorum TaxID=258 RepID=UPI003DA53358
MKLIKKALCYAILTTTFMSAIAFQDVQAQKKHTFEIKDGNFVYDGKTTRILSGEMHYARIPHQYWKHRLQMVKSMGLNTVATYVFWNFHEESPGNWNFEGDHDLAAFIKTAGEVGLHVILRPGPYACAEWDFGGYPWWLQKIDGLEIRRDNAKFLEYTKKYIDRLAKEVGSLQITNGGPIIMVQAENEFGSYVSQRKDIPLEEHKAYNAKIKKQLEEAGFNVPLFTSDGSWLFEGGAIPGALPTANGENNISNLKKVVDQYNNNQGPYMVAEFYPGWLDHWAEPFAKVDAGRIARQTEKYLQNDISFNYYMVHGGTNFGFTSGANYNNKSDIQPDITSYDYDAPISEAGWATPKYDSIRTVIQKYADYTIPAVPKANPVIEIPSIKLTAVANVFDYAKSAKTTINETPLNFEQLDQANGYVLYNKQFNQPINGKLKIDGLRDFAVVYIDGTKVGELNRVFKNYEMDIDIPFNSTLQILVENMGRINYGSEIIHNHKGIISPVLINDMEITGDWTMQQLPMDKVPDLAGKQTAAIQNTKTNASKTAALKGQPVLYQGTFDLKEIGDTFIDMEKWGKGIVFINGINIGRYWKTGPQHTLYIPGPYLKKGSNSIVIFEQLNDEIKTEVSTVKVPVLDKVVL